MKENKALYHNSRVLVVGTTPDYIDILRNSYHGRLLFLTDLSVRRRASEPAPSEDEEILSSLLHHSKARSVLSAHIAKWSLHISGIVCYDCESMLLASEIASEYSIPYPSAVTIGNCRSKYTSKVLWKQNGIKCPEAKIVQSPDEATVFLNNHGGICVLKPVTGTGSELVMICKKQEECKNSYYLISNGLQARKTIGLYNHMNAGSVDVIAEQYIGGEEYSCDFIINSSHVAIIRVTRKIPRHETSFGTIMAYVLESPDSIGIDKGKLKDVMGRAAHCLGINNALCMADFKVVDRDVLLLELTPRPGGDCIPSLMRHATGIDTRLIPIDMALGVEVKQKLLKDTGRHVCLMVHAGRSGIIDCLNTTTLEKDSRVLGINIYRKPGHVVIMPPDDYESWILGHIIFRAEGSIEVEKQCKEILGKIEHAFRDRNIKDVRLA